MTEDDVREVAMEQHIEAEVASDAAYRCTVCGREFAVDSQALHWQPSGGACASIIQPVRGDRHAAPPPRRLAARSHQ